MYTDPFLKSSLYYADWFVFLSCLIKHFSQYFIHEFLKSSSCKVIAKVLLFSICSWCLKGLYFLIKILGLIKPGLYVASIFKEVGVCLLNLNGKNSAWIFRCLCTGLLLKLHCTIKCTLGPHLTVIYCNLQITIKCLFFFFF